MSSTINILLLGETGVGKSTFVNGFCNYLAYETIQDAKTAPELKVPIPTQFTITNDAFEEVLVKLGKDDEDHISEKVGESVTQSTRIYPFQLQETETIINFIDTPGIGDTRGVVQDYSNLENIMKVLTPLEKLHGICILLKPNESRLTLSFRYCLQELLSHFHKEAIANVIFAFTNTRANFYRPGESLKILRQLLKDSLPKESSEKLVLGSSTIFCFDSEAFRYLAASRVGQSFSEEDSESFSQSWMTSKKESLRMLKRLETVQPHSINKTLELFQIRRIVDAIAKPVVDASLSIQVKIAEIEQLKERIKIGNKETANLSKNLLKETKQISKTPTSLRVVCNHEDCSEIISITKGMEVSSERHYSTVCHSDCRCVANPTKGVQSAIDLLKCSSLAGGKCNNCVHDWQGHLFIDYETSIVNNNPIDWTVGGQLLMNFGQTVWKGVNVTELEKQINCLKAESTKIEEVATNCMRMVKCNAIDDENDAMEEYMEQCVKRMQQDGISLDLDELLEMKKSYQVKLRCMRQQDVSNPDTDASLDKVKELVNELVLLKYSGKKIAEALKRLSFVQISLPETAVKETEKCIIS